MTTNKDKLTECNYVCETCDYITSVKCNYDKHLLTRKHTMTTTGLQKSNTTIICECGKSFSCRQNIYRHKKSCLASNNPYKIPSPIQFEQSTHIMSEDIQTNIILELVKQNKEFKDLLLHQSTQMIEQNKTIIEVAKNSNVNNNTIHNNSHNKTFNLHFFLNETCKDAMNMKDFIKSLELSIPELEKMGELGFAEGMSRVFVDRLNSMDITKRPIHCSDVKREIIHIKDDNKWERDNANLDRLRKIIKQLTHKNILRVDDWKKANPGCTEYNSRKNGQYLKLTMEAIGPVDDMEVKRDFGKIIRRVAESTIIDKKYLCI